MKRPMNRKRHRPEEVVAKLRQADEVSLLHFRGHPIWRESSPGVLHGQAYKDSQAAVTAARLHPSSKQKSCAFARPAIAALSESRKI